MLTAIEVKAFDIMIGKETIPTFVLVGLRGKRQEARAADVRLFVQSTPLAIFNILSTYRDTH